MLEQAERQPKTVVSWFSELKWMSMSDAPVLPASGLVEQMPLVFWLHASLGQDLARKRWEDRYE